MLYEHSLDLIKKTESIVIFGEPDVRFWIINDFTTKYLCPFHIMFDGLKLVITPLLKFCGIFISLSLVLIILGYFLRPENVFWLYVACGFILALIVTYFLPPSIHAAKEVNKEDIDKVTVQIVNKELTIKQLVIIKENIQIFENNFNKKVGAIKVALILPWSGFVYCMTQYYIPSLKLPEHGVVPNGELIFIFLLLMIMAHCSLKCYSLISKKIFSTFIYAINDCMSPMEEIPANDLL